MPDGIFVLYAPDGDIAGVVFNRLDGEKGEKVIDSPGVAPEYRHLGLSRPLVQHSMRWLNSQAVGDFHLHTWGDFDGAVAIYTDLGFSLKPENRMIEYLFAA